MARPLRIEYPGASYHVMNRGLARRDIFLENRIKRTFYFICVAHRSQVTGRLPAWRFIS